MRTFCAGCLSTVLNRRRRPERIAGAGLNSIGSLAPPSPPRCTAAAARCCRGCRSRGRASRSRGRARRRSRSQTGMSGRLSDSDSQWSPSSYEMYTPCCVAGVEQALARRILAHRVHEVVGANAGHDLRPRLAEVVRAEDVRRLVVEQRTLHRDVRASPNRTPTRR